MVLFLYANKLYKILYKIYIIWVFIGQIKQKVWLLQKVKKN